MRAGRTKSTKASAAKGQGLGGGDKDEDGDVFVNAGEDWFAGYHLCRDRLEWMKAQIRNHSTIARSFIAEKSFEGRHQAGAKIGTRPNLVVLHGLQHSRDWITGSVVEYLIYLLLTGTDGRVAGYLKKCTFHIIPIMNPDGFIIIQTTDRLHRKNAQTEGKCLGTDINRNRNFHWKCASNYRGPFAFSTPEATNIARYLKSLPNVATYTDIHAYGQLLLTPYGFTVNLPPNYNSYLKTLANGTVKALAAVHGTQFKAGDIYHTIYPASVSSIDYAMGEVHIPVPFGFELRETGLFGFELRETGLFGFTLPADQILPSGQETWAAFTYILGNLKDLK